MALAACRTAGAVAAAFSVLVVLLCCGSLVQAASRKKGIKRYDALVTAARKNDIKGVQQALKKGANVNMVHAAEWRQGKTAVSFGGQSER